MIYENGTMDVEVDGKIERRRFTINFDALFTNEYIKRIQTKYQPELHEGERAVFSVGSDIPHIVQERIP